MKTGSAPVIGDGPLYAVSLYSLAETGVLPFTYPPRRGDLFFGSHWGGQVIKWLADPRYDGPVLIRGRRLRKPRVRIGFSVADVPYAYSELQFPPGAGDPSADGWRGWGSYVRLRLGGCYGMQVDGTNFSETIVFRALRTR